VLFLLAKDAPSQAQAETILSHIGVKSILAGLYPKSDVKFADVLFGRLALTDFPLARLLDIFPESDPANQVARSFVHLLASLANSN